MDQGSTHEACDPVAAGKGPATVDSSSEGPLKRMRVGDSGATATAENSTPIIQDDLPDVLPVPAAVEFQDASKSIATASGCANILPLPPPMGHDESTDSGVGRLIKIWERYDEKIKHHVRQVMLSLEMLSEHLEDMKAIEAALEKENVDLKRQLAEM